MAKEMAKQQEGQMIKPEGALSPFDEMERWMDEFLPRRWMQRWGWPGPSVAKSNLTEGRPKQGADMRRRTVRRPNPRLIAAGIG